MAHEKQFTAKQVALTVLNKVTEMLKKSELIKSENYNPPSEITGQGDPLRRTKAQEDWQEKSEEMTKNEKIRQLQKSGMSPNQIEAQLQKDGKLEKKYEGFKAVEASAAKSGASDPAAVAAAIGRKKYGKKAFQEAAAHGHKMGKSELETDLENLEVLLKGETKHDRCVEHVKENSPEVKNPHAVCVAEGVKPEKWKKNELTKYETSNSKKLGYKLSEAGKEEIAPEKSDHAFDEKHIKDKSSDDPRQGHTPNPGNNPKEEVEGNNEKAGTTPTQVGQDGKNKPGYDEMKGHLKLAKFIGMKGYKRAKALKSTQSQSEAETQHKESVKDK